MGRTAKFAIHVFLVFCAFVFAYHLRVSPALEWWTTSAHGRTILLLGLVYAGIAGLVELVFRTERSAWQFSSARDVLLLIRSTGLAAGVFLLITFLVFRAEDLPRSTVIMAWVLSLAALVGVRLFWRLLHDKTLARSLLSFGRLEATTGVPLLLVGDALEAESYLRRTPTGEESEYSPVALFSDAAPKGQFVRGVQVKGGTRDVLIALPGLAPRKPNGAAILFFGDTFGGQGFTAEEIGRLRTQGFKLLRQPSLMEVQQDGVDVRAVREMKLEDFLPRPPVDMDAGPIRNLIHNKRVLVTGAGGSIGSEIVRQLVHHGCAHVTLVDHSEFLLFEIDYELSEAPLPVSRTAVLCNVRDEKRLQRVFEVEKPDIVFHAAALKHVTLVENNPREGVLTNVLGTWNVARAAARNGVRQMVLISTDKAANPTNIMGATKRLAESLLRQEGASTRYCVVRFGNVLGSAGSVVPIFQRQIESGGPVTVTDPLVERFFMTIPEAVQLVLQASALSARGDGDLRKFVLEMGRPVKIIELARQMIELGGLRPDEDIKIEITGLRPGEKITEILVDDYEEVVACVPGINEIQANASEYLDSEQVQGIIIAATTDEDGLNTRIYSMVRALRHRPEAAD
jgi:O-antigen biosynthesis protein WbqV